MFLWCSAAGINDRMIYFGGGANISDDLVILQYDTRDTGLKPSDTADGMHTSSSVSAAMMATTTATSSSSATAAATADEDVENNNNGDVNKAPSSSMPPNSAYMHSTLYRPTVLPSRYRPSVRTSTTAAVIGPYWCMFGGWNKSRRVRTWHTINAFYFL